MNLNELVKKYIQLRDKKAEFKAEYDAKVAQVEQMLGRVEAALLAQFTETGVESVRTDSGTAYVSTRASAGVADWDALLEFIKGQQLWMFLERRVNKTAVEQYKAANEELPPGVNWREEKVVNIRRSA